ncbi:MAG: hypothetical protein ACFE9I_18220 [Candidatus Hermodarchaeota archaeon]
MKKSRDKNEKKSVGKIALVIILVTASAAFLTLWHNYLLADIADLNAEIQNIEAVHERMESMATSLGNNDKDSFLRSLDYSNEVKMIDYEYWQLNATLTLEEKKVYLYNIINLIQTAINYRSSTSIISIYRHFNRTTNDLIITTEQIAGFDYRITWEIWESFITTYGPQIYEINASEAYGHLHSFDDIQTRPLEGPNEPLRPKDLKTGKEIFFDINQTVNLNFGQITDFFLFSPVVSLQEEINLKLIELERIETSPLLLLIALIIPAVTLIAVGLEYIANKISDKKSERQIKDFEQQIKELKDLLENKKNIKAE